MDKVKRHSKRLLIAIVGTIVLLLGIVMIPYPGPGWLVVFAGLAILATEFAFARRVLDFAKDKYDLWAAWLKRQNKAVQVGVLALTGIVIVVTIWLLNGFGIVNSVLSLGQDWLVSPLFR